MAFSIADITGALKYGGARPTLFQVRITKSDLPEMKNFAPFFIQSAQIPSSSISSIEVPYFGRKIKVAGDRTFDTWQVTIMNDEDFKLRDMFENWHNKINTLYTNLNAYESAAPANYKTDAQVWQYSKSSAGSEDATELKPLRVYQFSGLFPTDISPIELDWSATDQIETFTVTFAYDYFEVVQGSTLSYGRIGTSPTGGAADF